MKIVRLQLGSNIHQKTRKYIKVHNRHIKDKIKIHQKKNDFKKVINLTKFF